jgi:plasmid stability protein
MQYTIRNIPEHLDAALRSSARASGKSLNEIAIEALERGAGISGAPRRQRDLSDIAGTWQEDPEFDRAIADQDKIDEAMWP